uniref:LicD family protein n=1 Tax=uncultured Psychrobacter sp. TaxID=259303 RepID=UPI00262DB18E|nr:LicD family protein [uncultured Psychrobacter sp.]
MKLTIEELQKLETEMLREVSSICKNNDISYFIAYGTGIGAIRHQGPIPWDADADIIVPYKQLESFISTVRENISDKFFLDFHDINPYYTATFPRIGLKGYSSVALHLDVFIACGIPKNKEEQTVFFDKSKKLCKIHYYKTASEKYRGKLSKKHKVKILLYRMRYIATSLESIRKKFYYMCNENNYEDSEYITNPSGGYGYKEIIPKAYLGAGKPMNYAGFFVNAPEKTDLYLEHFYGNYLSFPHESDREIKSVYNIHRLELD